MTDDDGTDAAGGLGNLMKTGFNEHVSIMLWKWTDHEIILHHDVWEEHIQDLITTSVCRWHGFVSFGTVNTWTNFLLATKKRK